MAPSRIIKGFASLSLKNSVPELLAKSSRISGENQVKAYFYKCLVLTRIVIVHHLTCGHRRAC